jgi:hypothetical protein
MTPRIWNKISAKIAPYELKLAKYGLAFFVLFIVSVLINSSIANTLYPLVIVPFGVTIFLAGFGVIIPTFIDAENNDFESYWKSIGVAKKLHLWFVSIITTFSYLLLTLIIIGALLITIMLELNVNQPVRCSSFSITPHVLP